jgi:hypothetical protein
MGHVHTVSDYKKLMRQRRVFLSKEASAHDYAQMLMGSARALKVPKELTSSKVNCCNAVESVEQV